jgi:hypothetical protein
MDLQMQKDIADTVANLGDMAIALRVRANALSAAYFANGGGDALTDAGVQGDNAPYRTKQEILDALQNLFTIADTITPTETNLRKVTRTIY